MFRIENNQKLSSWVVRVLLAVIVTAGFTLRVWNVNFDRGIGSHPDERSTACFRATMIRLPVSWEQFWDTRQSPLNPLWNIERQEATKFTYGHFPLYLGVAFGQVLHEVAPLGQAFGLPESWTTLMARADASCDAIAVAGRLVIGALDTLTIVLLFWLARRIYGSGAGVVAAAFYAFTAQAIQLSHFFAMDPASTTFTVMAILGGVMMVQERTLRAALIAGVGAGLAIACKFSALPILAVPVVAVLLMVWSRPRPEGSLADQHTGSKDSAASAAEAQAQFAALVGVPLALSMAAAVFFVTSPYAVLDWQNFVQATLVEQGAMVRGIADFPFTRQYRNTMPYLYFIDQQVRWGLGWPLGVVAAAGVLYALGVLLLSLFQLASSWLARQGARWVSAEGLALIVVWSWVIPYFGITGAFLAKFNRYMSPILPFVLLFAAGLIARLWQMANSERHNIELPNHPVTPSPRHPITPSRILAILLTVCGIGGGLFWSAAYVNGVYDHEHTWLTASRWIYQNTPRGAVLLWESWDDPLPKTIPDEPAMDMGSTGLRNIDWSPYEEDTAEKYAQMKGKLREANYVVYSSKRIYESVDELPERYPMTTRYYDTMWSGELGFDLVQDVTSPPRLFGMVFEDREADESWSLYDHPQVTIFRKTRDLSDAEYDALFAGTWEEAIPYYRGEDSPLSPLLNLLGLGNQPESQDQGLINALVSLVMGREQNQTAGEAVRPSLLLDRPLADLPVVDNYRWNSLASNSPVLAIIWWWLVLAMLGWAAWPLAFYLLRPFRDRGYFLSRTLGWLLAGWLLWWLAGLGWAMNSVVNAWLALAILALVGASAAVWQWGELRVFIRDQWPLLLAGEGLFAIAYIGFVLIRMTNPDLWQPWFGGEKFMEFAFLNGILRSPFFPPVDPHFAGGYINYYYFGIYLVAYLIKLTGIYAEVAFNLAIPTLFALTAINAFAVVYSAGGGWRAADEEEQASNLNQSLGGDQPTADGVPAHATGDEGEAQYAMGDDSGTMGKARGTEPPSKSPNPKPKITWRTGFAAALFAPLFVTLIGNLDGFAQIVRNLAQIGTTTVQTSFGVVQTTLRAVDGLRQVWSGQQSMPAYDFWGPSRVIPATINEFPYWSFLFADLHPHVIGIPLALLFLAAVYTLIAECATDWRAEWRRGLALLGAFALLLGTLASVNLWELPTYFGIGVLALLVSQMRGRSRIHWPATGVAAVIYLAGAYFLYWPFFRYYANVGASGIGWVKEGDATGQWLLIWGFLAFVLVSWLFYTAARPIQPARVETSLVTRVRRQAAPVSPFVMGIVWQPGGLRRELANVNLVLATPEEETNRAGPAAPAMQHVKPLAGERWLSQALRYFDRLPRLIYLQRLLVERPSLGYLLTPVVVLGAIVAALLAWWAGRTVLALCLAPLGIGLVLLWRRCRAADPGGQFVIVLIVTGLAILAGAQLVYLKDFLSGGDWYRMNTLFKFFSQVWVLWGVAAALAAPRLWNDFVSNRHPIQRIVGANLWSAVFALLLVASFAYPIYGTPARLDMRMVGWRPPFGTLNALDYMREGSYTWPDEQNRFELMYDREAIQWLLDHVRGNAVIVESATVAYYREGGSRIASTTGLSGVSGMHEGEQRYGEQVGIRDGLHREFWSTPDVGRTQQIIDELDIALIYVGQLEAQQHPEGVQKIAQMVSQGLFAPVFENELTSIYSVPGRLVQTPDGVYLPQPGNQQ